MEHYSFATSPLFHLRPGLVQAVTLYKPGQSRRVTTLDQFNAGNAGELWFGLVRGGTVCRLNLSPESPPL
jgi:hypothetical protein